MCTIYSLNKDILLEIVKNLSPFDKFTLYLSNRFFKKCTYYDYSLITFRKAILTKNIENIKLIEYIKGYKIDLEKHLITIVNTKDFEIIRTLIKEPSHYLTVWYKHTHWLIKYCSPECIYYLFSSNIHYSQRKAIILCNRIDIIHYYLQKNIVFFCLDNIFTSSDESIDDLDLLKYLHSIGISLTVNNLIKGLMNTDTNYSKWVLQTLCKDNITENNTLDYLYKHIYYTYPQVYVHVIKNNMFDFISDDKDAKKYIAYKKNIQSLVKDASKNIFTNIYDLSNDPRCTIEIYQLIYYCVIYNQKSIYEKYFNTTFEFERFEQLKLICELNSPNCIYEYDLIDDAPKCSKFLMLYSDTIISGNMVKFVDMLLSKYSCNIEVAIHYHERGIRNSFYKIIENSICGLQGKRHDYINHLLERETLTYKDIIIYICESSDLDLIKKLYKVAKLSTKNILKYCSKDIILKLFLKTETNKLSQEIIYSILRHGNMDIVKHCVEHEIMDKYSLYYGFLNSISIAKHILTSSSYEQFSICDFIIIDNPCYVHSTTKPRGFRSIPLESNTAISHKSSESENNNTYYTKHLSKYFTWFISLNPEVNIFETVEIIESDNVQFYEYLVKQFPITKQHIFHAIESESYKILEYIGSIGKLVIPFCCYNSLSHPYCSSNSESAISILTTILNSKCECPDLVLNVSNKLYLFVLLIFIKIYLQSLEKHGLYNSLTDYSIEYSICGSNIHVDRNYEYIITTELTPTKNKYILTKVYTNSPNSESIIIDEFHEF